MDLNQYFALPESKSPSVVAREVGVSPAVVYQWRRKLRPIPTEYGAPLEVATDGLVSRRDNWGDWARIWPELVTAKSATEAA